MAFQYHRFRSGSSMVPIVVGLERYLTPGPVADLSTRIYRSQIYLWIPQQMDTHQQPTTKCQPVIPPEYRYFLTLIAHIPVPVPRSKILCGWGIMGARNNFLSSSITYFAWDISIRSSSSSSIGSPYSTHRCQNSAPVLDLWISPSFPYAAYVLPCSSI